MRETLFIHGYAVDLDTWFRKPLPAHAGFQVFEEEIVKGEATVFHWTKHYPLSFVQTLWPLTYVQHYKDERTLARSEESLHALGVALEKKQPETIVCHSMGCYVLLEYVKNTRLPESVKKVVYLQGDCSAEELIASSLLQGGIEVITSYRILDHALWFSSLYHRKKRIGVQKIRDNRITCIYMPSFKKLNSHMAILFDEKLRRVVNGE